MKGFIKILAALLIVASLVLCVTCCAPDEEAGVPGTFVSISINPEIELTLDKDGKVTSVYGANEDGKVLLYGEVESIVGLDYEAAAEYVTTLAVELGYIEEGHEISASVTSKDENVAKTIEEKISAKISETASGLGFTVTVSGELAHALIRELREFKEKHPDSETIQNLTPEKFKLMISASEEGEISLTAAAELSDAELIKKIEEGHKRLGEHATEAYRAAKAHAQMAYDLAEGVALDGIYNAIYLERLTSLISNPEYRDTFYYGALYQAYKTAERTFRALGNVIDKAEEIGAYEPDEAIVLAILSELGIENTEVARDESGKITAASLIAFAESYIDENELSEECKERVDDLLDELEELAERAAVASERYKAQLSALKLQIETIAETLEATATPVYPLLSEEGKAEFEAAVGEISALAAAVGEKLDEGLTEDELEELEELAEEKASALLEKINAELSEDELKKVEEMKEKLSETMEKNRAELSERLERAETEAKEKIERHREERRTHGEKH